MLIVVHEDPEHIKLLGDYTCARDFLGKMCHYELLAIRQPIAWQTAGSLYLCISSSDLVLPPKCCFGVDKTLYCPVKFCMIPKHLCKIWRKITGEDTMLCKGGKKEGKYYTIPTELLPFQLLPPPPH